MFNSSQTGPEILHVTTSFLPVFPLGPTVEWTSAARRTYSATLIGGVIAYVVVRINPDELEVAAEDLEHLRKDLGREACWDSADAEPKIGCLDLSGGPTSLLTYRVRQSLSQGPHPGMAASGIAMLAAVAGTAGTVVDQLLGRTVVGACTVLTPAGPRTFSVDPPDAMGAMRIEYPLSPITPIARGVLPTSGDRWTPTSTLPARVPTL